MYLEVATGARFRQAAHDRDASSDAWLLPSSDTSSTAVRHGDSCARSPACGHQGIVLFLARTELNAFQEPHASKISKVCLQALKQHPRKRLYRARAHSNPLNDASFDVPAHPDEYDW